MKQSEKEEIMMGKLNKETKKHITQIDEKKRTLCLGEKWCRKCKPQQ